MSDILEVHPWAEKFPLMPENEFEELKADILKNDLKEKIVVYEGQILDGRHRVRALTNRAWNSIEQEKLRGV